jgi:hypothetical protein
MPLGVLFEEGTEGSVLSPDDGPMLLFRSLADTGGMLDQAVVVTADSLATERAGYVAVEFVGAAAVRDVPIPQPPEDVAALAIPAVLAIIHIFVIYLCVS